MVTARQTRASLAVCAILVLSGCSSTSNPPPPPPPGHITPNTQGWWRDKVFYEIFVRSFADSNGDGVGDLQGL
ncbi:MAG: alpha-amylase family glycosyl hydrolase, partial [Myxococcaceae bacterium]